MPCVTSCEIVRLRSFQNPEVIKKPFFLRSLIKEPANIICGPVNVEYDLSPICVVKT